MNYFDLHCDTAYECFTKNKNFCDCSLAVNANYGKSFCNWSQVFAIWIKDDAENPWQFYKNIIWDFKKKLENSKSQVKPYFAVEGGALLEGDTDRLYHLKEDKIRFLSLTWNGENSLAGGVKTDKGLTETGIKAIEVMNKLKIGCDLSHLNDKSFYDVIQRADYPLATHSCSRELVNNKRNLTNDQIKLISAKKGVIGLCFYPEFVGEEVFEGLYRNVFHICNMGYENNICFGSDFDGAKMHASLKNILKIPSLFEYLEKKGVKRDLLCKIFYKNAENYIANLI